MSDGQSSTDIGQNATGEALQLFLNAISPSLMPGDQLPDKQVFPTALMVGLFGPDEDWLVRGEEVGGALLRKLGLRGSMNSERVLRVAMDWFRTNHPGAEDIGVDNADYKGADVRLRVDYPPEFILGIIRRLTWDTRGKNAEPDGDDPYCFRITF